MSLKGNWIFFAEFWHCEDSQYQTWPMRYPVNRRDIRRTEVLLLSRHFWKVQKCVALFRRKISWSFQQLWEKYLCKVSIYHKLIVYLCEKHKFSFLYFEYILQHFTENFSVVDLIIYCITVRNYNHLLHNLHSKIFHIRQVKSYY